MLDSDKMEEEIGFSDIVQTAEQLSAEIESTSELPRVQRSLRQILEAGQQLLDKTNKSSFGGNAQTRASIFLGTKGVDVTKMQQSLDPLSRITTPTDTKEPPIDVDINGFLKSERLNAICSIVDQTKTNLVNQIEDSIWNALEVDWRKEKERIMSSLTGLRPLEFEKTSESRENTSLLNKDELTYTSEIDQYNKAIIHNLSRPNLLERIEAAAKNSGDKNIQDMWTSIVSIVGNLPTDPKEEAIKKRSKPENIKMLISRARKYLEKSQWKKIQSEVFSNLGRSQLGGVPDSLQMIKSYVAIKGFSSNTSLEIIPGDSGPVWVIVYYCLRSGKTEAAIRYLRDVVGNNDFSYIVEDYLKSDPEAGGNGSIPKDVESKVRLEYRRLKNTNRDIYKKIVYCIIGACDIQDDHPEVATRLDDYLWLRLAQLRDSENRVNQDFMNYSSFQELILEKYGERHFDAYKQPFVYFQALLLTGQFEASIEFLSRISGMKSHAVHFALILNEIGWLIISEPKAPLLSKRDADPQGLRRLNFSNLVVQYAKNIQGTNTKEALNYLYFLRNIIVTDETDKENLFSVCVSDLAIESKEFAVLFGKVNEEGLRTSGLLESMGINVAPIIEFCASESENNGMMEDAIILYDLAGRFDLSLRVLNRIMSQTLNHKPLPDSPRQRIRRIALMLAERYQRLKPSIDDSTILNNFYTLLDLMTFFDEYHAKKVDSSIFVMEKLRLLPMNQADIERSVSNFHLLTDEIRVNIPLLILATIECIHEKYKKLKSEKKGFASDSSTDLQYLAELKEQAKSITTYCGTIPYMINSDIYSKVVQIEVQLN